MDQQELKRLWLTEALRTSGKKARDVARECGIPETNLSAMRNGHRPITDHTIDLMVQRLGIQPPTMHVERTLPNDPTHGDKVPAFDYGRNLAAELDELHRLVNRLVLTISDLRSEVASLQRSRQHGNR